MVAIAHNNRQPRHLASRSCRFVRYVYFDKRSGLPAFLSDYVVGEGMIRQHSFYFFKIVRLYTRKYNPHCFFGSLVCSVRYEHPAPIADKYEAAACVNRFAAQLFRVAVR